MLESYGRLQILVHLPGSRVTQNSKISQFSTRGRGRGGSGRGRGYRGRGHVRGRGRGCGGKEGRGVRSYGHNPYKFAIKYGTFMVEACVYPSDQWILLSLQQKKNIQEIKVCEGWRGFDVPPAR